MNTILRRAMQDSDNFVVEFDYVDSKGQTTRRVISPIRFMPGNRLLALCLCREAPRQFHLARCSNVRLCRAEQYMMPVAMTTV
jgi:predicted DNA-binding transcriptional regulator YafY